MVNRARGGSTASLRAGVPRERGSECALTMSLAGPQQRERTVVSVTPLPLDKDSRTWKQAKSLAGAGYRSIVIAAGRRHEIGAGSTLPSSGASSIAAASVTESRMAGWRAAEAPWLAHAVLFAGWLGLYGLRYVARPLATLPAADLYVLHECSTYPAVRARAALSGAPYIYDAHDLYSAIEPEGRRLLFDARFIVPMTRSLERRSVGDAAAVMTVSDGLASTLEATHGTKPIVVRNVHDGRLDRSGVETLRQRFGLDASATLLVTVGNAKRGQALSQAIEALALLPQNVHWAFVGDGYTLLLAEAQTRGVAERVHLAGRLQPDEIVPTIRDADAAVVLYHAYSENYRLALPNGLFQAIAAGLPQIVPPLPEIQALADSYGFALVADPTSPEAIAAAVRTLIEDAPVRERLATASGRAREELSWAQEEKRFLGLVTSIIDKGHA